MQAEAIVLGCACWESFQSDDRAATQICFAVSTLECLLVRKVHGVGHALAPDIELCPGSRQRFCVSMSPLISVSKIRFK